MAWKQIDCHTREKSFDRCILRAKHFARVSAHLIMISRVSSTLPRALQHCLLEDQEPPSLAVDESRTLDYREGVDKFPPSVSSQSRCLDTGGDRLFLSSSPTLRALTTLVTQAVTSSLVQHSSSNLSQLACPLSKRSPTSCIPGSEARL